MSDGIKVIADEVSSPVHVFDDDLNPKEVGTIVSRIYQGESVQRHLYLPAGKSPEEKDNWYSLGPTTNRFKFTDHTEALEPLLDAGWKIRTQLLSKGGLRAYTILHPDDPVLISDVINWDHEFWGTVRQDNPLFDKLTEAIIVKTSVQPGAGMSYSRAYWRFICTNGMTAKLLELATVRMNHGNWDGNALSNRLLGSNVVMHPSPEKLRGPYIGTSNGVRRLASFIEDQFLGDGPISNRQIPKFVEDSIKALEDMPKWYLSRYQEQLKLMASGVTGGSVHAFDLMNGITNAVNYELATQKASSDPDAPVRASGRILGKSDTILEHSMRLVGTFSLIGSSAN